jgi:CitMHS family citrate-Mg2+:H+ or citrate-Ca2+:H+ symporter
MLTFLGFAMIVVFMYLIMSNKMSALTALLLIPAIFGVLAGSAPAEVGKMMIDGAKSVSSTAIMVMFAILYFGILTDAGMFDPLVDKVMKLVKGDPLKITIGTAILSLLVGLDGDGTITYLIVVTTFLPLYNRLGMNKLILACLPALAMGIMNVLPWGGPTARVMSVFNYEATEILNPLMPSIIAACIYVIVVAGFLGLKERKRVGVNNNVQHEMSAENGESALTEDAEAQSLKRPKLFLFNVGVTILLVVGLLTELLPLATLFILGFAIVSTVNYPNVKIQKKRVEEQAANVLGVISLVFAGGAFAGILDGTGIVNAMADSLVRVIPNALASQMPLFVSITSMPFTFFMANDPYYFGIIPILAETATRLGIDQIEIAQASLLGQPLHLLSPLVGSVYVIIGLVGIEFKDHIRFATKYAVGTAMVMIIVGVITGVLSI